MQKWSENTYLKGEGGVCTYGKDRAKLFQRCTMRIKVQRA